MFGGQHTALGYLIGLLSIAVLIAHRPRFEQQWILTLKLRDWFSKRSRPDDDGTKDEGLSRYSTTLFSTVWYHEDRPEAGAPAEEVDTVHEQHETKHVHQFTDAAAQGFWVGLAAASASWAFGWCVEAWQPLAVWEVVWLLLPVSLACTWLTALLRYGPAAKVRPDGTPRSLFARVYDRAYLDSEIERSARAQTQYVDGTTTWADRERGRR